MNLKNYFFITISFFISFGLPDEKNRNKTVKKTIETTNCCGRCTGSSNCSACSNCSRCAHCSSGGSCGVCSSSYNRPTSKYKSSSRSASGNSGNIGSSKNSYNNSTTDKKIITGYYYVKATQLNLRENPSTQAKVLYQLKAGDQVEVIESFNSGWSKIIISTADGDITGYVLSIYLKGF